MRPSDFGDTPETGGHRHKGHAVEGRDDGINRDLPHNRRKGGHNKKRQ